MYINLGYVRERTSYSVLVTLTGDPISRGSETIDDIKLQTEIDRAGGIINDHLRGRYTVPLASPMDIVKDWQYNIVLFNLYKDRTEGRNVPDAIKDEYDRTMSALEKYRDGRISLPETTASVESMVTPMIVKSPARIFNDDLFSRM